MNLKRNLMGLLSLYILITTNTFALTDNIKVYKVGVVNGLRIKWVKFMMSGEQGFKLNCQNQSLTIALGLDPYFDPEDISIYNDNPAYQGAIDFAARIKDGDTLPTLTCPSHNTGKIFADSNTGKYFITLNNNDLNELYEPGCSPLIEVLGYDVSNAIEWPGISITFPPKKIGCAFYTEGQKNKIRSSFDFTTTCQNAPSYSDLEETCENIRLAFREDDDENPPDYSMIWNRYLQDKPCPATLPLPNICPFIDLSFSSYITDLEPLAFMHTIKGLDLSGNKITSLTNIGGLGGTVYLDLSSNTNLADISPLANLVRLEHLDLSATNVVDLRALRELPRLNFVEADWTEVDPSLCPQNAKSDVLAQKCRDINHCPGNKAIGDTWWNPITGGQRKFTCVRGPTVQPTNEITCNSGYRRQGDQCTAIPCTNGKQVGEIWLEPISNGNREMSCQLGPTIGATGRILCNSSYQRQGNQCVATPCSNGKQVNEIWWEAIDHGSKEMTCQLGPNIAPTGNINCDTNYEQRGNVCVLATCSNGHNISDVWWESIPGGKKQYVCQPGPRIAETGHIECDESHDLNGGACVLGSCSNGKKVGDTWWEEIIGGKKEMKCNSDRTITRIETSCDTFLHLVITDDGPICEFRIPEVIIGSSSGPRFDEGDCWDFRKQPWRFTREEREELDILCNGREPGPDYYKRKWYEILSSLVDDS